MRVVVPYAATEPKTRLADVLSPDERAAFAEAMLADVLAAVRATGRDPEVLATAPVETDAPVTVDDRPLTEAVNAVLAGTDGPVAVVMADLALATPPRSNDCSSAANGTTDEGATSRRPSAKSPSRRDAAAGRTRSSCATPSFGWTTTARRFWTT